MRCQVCGKCTGTEGSACDWCGATIKSRFGEAPPPPIPLTELRAAEEKRARQAERLRNRIRNHTIAGAAIFFGLNVVVWIMKVIITVFVGTIAIAIGHMPGGGGNLAWAMFMSVVFAVVLSVVAGAPAGYFISKRNAGPAGGALIATPIFALALALWNLVMSGGAPGAVTSGLVTGAIIGFVTGIFIGYHVRMDDA